MFISRELAKTSELTKFLADPNPEIEEKWKIFWKTLQIQVTKKHSFNRILINMAYNSKHVQILDPEKWYNLISDQYKQYHSHLDSFFNLEIFKFLPREYENLDIIDLGAWDGRVFKYFENVSFRKYVACDIAEKLLRKHPGKWIKVQK